MVELAHLLDVSLFARRRRQVAAGALRFCQNQSVPLNTSPPSSHPIKCCLSRATFPSPDVQRLEDWPSVQMLSSFPKHELLNKAVLLRFDSSVLLEEDKDRGFASAIQTIHYLLSSGAKIFLVGEWGKKKALKFRTQESVADRLSSILGRRVIALKRLDHGTMAEEKQEENWDLLLVNNMAEFKEEVANCPKFAKKLALGIDIFVNDSFSLSHKILSSTVGVTRFCYARMAGFHFEDCLGLMKKATDFTKRPSVAVVGGTKLIDKQNGIHFLCSKCDVVVFAGTMSFQIMNAMGIRVPPNLLEPAACKAASNIVHQARLRNVALLCPIDFWCLVTGKLEIVNLQGISECITPVELGPASLKKIESLLANTSKVTWIGPVNFRSSANLELGGSVKLGEMLHVQSLRGCDVSVVGEIPCRAMKEASCAHGYNRIPNSAVFWEFLNGEKLHGVMALDRAYPLQIDWFAAFSDPTQSLAIDIGSGNGMFIFQMARTIPDVNFLGLESNKMLVKRCLDLVAQSDIKNAHFIATNATSTFRTIVSSYPGKLMLVSIQCPNPDFTNPEHRWRLLQRSLVEAIADLLARDGEVFLQSDVEVVALRMRQLFLQYGKEKLILQHPKSGTWLKENPFAARSDWEHHTLERGDTMYRLILKKLY